MRIVRRTFSRPLVGWSVGVLVLVAGHDLSHAIDDGLETSLGALAVVAVPQWVLLTVLLGVIIRGDRARSAVAALLLAGGVVVGFTMVHLLPLSSASYWHLHPSALSWLLALAPPAAGLRLATVAWQQWRAALATPLARRV